MAERVNIALFERVGAADRRVTLRLEERAGLILIHLGWRTKLQLRGNMVERAKNLIICLLQLGRGVADRKCARHIVIEAAAMLAREDVENDRLAEPERCRLIAGGVRQAGV